MNNNPLLTIMNGVKDFKKLIQSGDISNLNPEFKKKFDKMTEAEKAQYKKEFKKQAHTSPELSNAMNLIKGKMEELKKVSKNMNNANH